MRWKNIGSISRKLLLFIAAFIVAISSQTTIYALDEIFTIGNDIYYYNPDDRCVGEGSSISSISAFKGKVRVAQANIKQHHEDVPFLVKKNNPDFIILSETYNRSPAQLTPNGYSFFRGEGGNNQERSTAVLWKSDTWNKVDSGRVLMVRNGPMQYDSGRASNWVSLQNSAGAIISVMSVHHMQNPNRFGADIRKELYGKGMDALTEKIKELSALGPVIAAGDFNFQIGDDDSYGPRKKLAKVNMESTHDSLGRLDGAYVDYIFYSKNLKADSHSIIRIGAAGNHSDHPYLFATLSGTGAAGSSGGVIDSGGCICRDPNASSTSLTGNKNDEKVFNYFVSKGLSDVQAAGVAGNIAIESGFDPERIQGKAIGEGSKDPNDAGSSGWGLIQWTPGSKVIPAAKAAGLGDRPIHELATQLDLIWGHMQNKPPITKGSFSIPEYKKITDIEKAVFYFEDKIEGAGKPNYPDRYTAARLVLDKYGGESSVSPASSFTNSSIDDCDSIGDGAAAGNAIQTALNYAWPEYHAPNYLNLKPAYQKAVDAAISKRKYVGGGPNPGVDCGGFVTRVMQDSGLDPEYGKGGNTDSQEQHLMESGKYRKINNPTSADLPPGAIAISSDYGGDGGGHTYIYVGKQAGFETQVASASYSRSNTSWRAPMAGHELVADPNYNWYVLK